MPVPHDASDAVTPLYSPSEGIRYMYTFVCDIEDDVSLWKSDDRLRVYVANGVGMFLDEMTQRRGYPQIYKHLPLIETYARMLGCKTRDDT